MAHTQNKHGHLLVVPYSNKREDGCDIRHLPAALDNRGRLVFHVPAQRDVHVPHQPLVEAGVPPSPEVSNRERHHHVPRQVLRRDNPIQHSPCEAHASPRHNQRRCVSVLSPVHRGIGGTVRPRMVRTDVQTYPTLTS